MFLLAERLNCPCDYLIVSNVAVLRNSSGRGNGRRNSNQAIVIGGYDTAMIQPFSSSMLNRVCTNLWLRSCEEGNPAS